jgi:murein tripeptide amidase MpaA
MNVRFLLGVLALPLAVTAAEPRAPIRFDTGFEGGSLGRIEQVGEGAYRLRVAGQQDNRGHNWQATWFYFRMDGVRDRELNLTFTDFLGEYNDKPGIAHISAEFRPVISYDGENWTHFTDAKWDDTAKELSLRFKPAQERVWLAFVPPYPHSRLLALLEEVKRSPHARVEVIGRTALGRELHRIVVDMPARPGVERKTVWLQARQHAWEAGTSFVMEGAIKFILSDDPRAQELRGRTTFIFTPMVDPDGSATGKVRFNVHGYDLNRHWDELDLKDRRWLEKIPETWYLKQTVVAHLDSGKRIDLFLNLHNTEMPEYINMVSDGVHELPAPRKLHELLVARTTFDPNRPFTIVPPGEPTVPNMYAARGVAYCMMEQRIGFGKKLGRLPTTQDRLEFGRQLIQAMAEAAR